MQSSINVTVNSIVALDVDPAAAAVNCMVFEVPPSSRLVALMDKAPVWGVNVNILASKEDVFLRKKVYESGHSCGNKLAKEAFSCWEPEFTT